MNTALPLFDYALRARDAGMARAEEAQEFDTPGFSDAALGAILAVAKRQIHVHIDDVLAETSLRPAHYNAWGAVWTRAIRAGIIQRSNQTKPCMTDPKKHGHSYPVYFSRVYQGRFK